MVKPIFPPNRPDPNMLPNWLHNTLIWFLILTVLSIFGVNVWAGIVTHGGRL